MKKKIFAAVVAFAMIIISSMTAFAAGINQNEQAVIDKLSSTSVSFKGRAVSLPASYINQARNYMYTVDLTKDQCDRIIALIDEAKSIMENSGAKSFSTLSADAKSQVLAKANEIASILKMTVTEEKTDQGTQFTLKDDEGNVAFSASPKVTSDGQLIDGTVVKTTGAYMDFSSLYLVLTFLSLIAASSCVYLVKSSKEAKYE